MDLLKEYYVNFIKNRNLIQLNNILRFGLWFIALIFCCILPWQNTTIYEKILLVSSIWSYLFIVLLYANNERMKNLIKKNSFYGWSFYIISLLMLYAIYRIQFQDFNWIIISIFVVEPIIQSLLWIMGLKRNIRLDNYKEKNTFKIIKNIFTEISIVIFLSMVIGINIYYVNLNATGIVLGLMNCLYFIHIACFFGMTFIFQNYSIKKFNLYDYIV